MKSDCIWNLYEFENDWTYFNDEKEQISSDI
jgi:hypothetical protein